MNSNHFDDTTLQSNNQDYRFATVVERTGTHVKVKFDGEDEVSEIEYPILSETYIPNANYAAGDRVLMLRTAGTYIIMGKLRSVYVPEEVAFHEDFSMWPGPKYIINGNTEKGYFGRIPQNEFISYEGFCDELGIDFGEKPVYSRDSPEWLKFIFKGQVMYVPSMPIRISGHTFQIKYQNYTGVGEMADIWSHQKEEYSLQFSRQASNFFLTKRIITISGFKMSVDLMTMATTSPIDSTHELDPSYFEHHDNLWKEMMIPIFMTWDPELVQDQYAIISQEREYDNMSTYQGRPIHRYYQTKGICYILGKEFFVSETEDSKYSKCRLRLPTQGPLRTNEKVGLMPVLKPYREDGKEAN